MLRYSVSSHTPLSCTEMHEQCRPVMQAALQADMELDAASIDPEEDALTTVDADNLPGGGAESSPSQTTLQAEPSSLALAEGHKRKQATLGITASKSKIARSACSCSSKFMHVHLQAACQAAQPGSMLWSQECAVLQHRTRHRPGKAKGRS